MMTENLSTLKIHRLTQAQYDREFAKGAIDESALYLTPDIGGEWKTLADVTVTEDCSGFSVSLTDKITNYRECCIYILNGSSDMSANDAYQYRLRIGDRANNGSSIVIANQLFTYRPSNTSTKLWSMVNIPCIYKLNDAEYIIIPTQTSYGNNSIPTYSPAINNSYDLKKLYFEPLNESNIYADTRYIVLAR